MDRRSVHIRTIKCGMWCTKQRGHSKLRWQRLMQFRIMKIWLLLILAHVAVAFKGVTIVDNIQWYLNNSFALDHALLYKRTKVTEYNLSSVAVYGQVELLVDLPCDITVEVAATPQIRGLFSSKPYLTAKDTGAAGLAHFRSNASTLARLAMEVIPTCFDADYSCPLKAGVYTVKDSCLIDVIVEMPERIWNASGIVRHPTGVEIARAWGEGHLDETPILRVKRPSTVQLRERIRSQKARAERRKAQIMSQSANLPENQATGN